MIRGLGLAAAVLAATTVTGCGGLRATSTAPGGSGTATGTSAVCAGFGLSLALDKGGRPTPLDAVTWWLSQGDTSVAAFPRQGWVVAEPDAAGVTVRSGRATMHVVRFTDATWAVDGGRTC